MTSKTSPSSPGCHHTMMSSSTEPSASSSRWVYWARPGPILPRSLDSTPCSVSRASGTGDLDGAEVRDVEHHGGRPAGQVLGERAGRVLERHLPAPERHHPCARARGGRRRAASARRHVRWHDGAAAARASSSSGTSWASMSSLTPASGSTLSTPWPRRRTSTSWSPSHSITWLPLITMWAAAMSDVTCSTEVGEHLANRLEADAGVEQGLDHAQLEQVAVGVAAPAPAAGGLGQRRADQVGAGPVVELAVRDADDLRRLRPAVPGIVTFDHGPTPFDGNIGVVTSM